MPSIDGTNITYDILVDAPEQRLIIEILRVQDSAEHYNRFLHHLLVAIMEFSKDHKQYRSDRTVHTIIWLNRRVQDKKLQKSVITTSFQTIDEMRNRIALYPHTLHLLNPYYVNAQTSSGMADWFKLVVESIENPTQPNINLERSIIEKATQLIAEDGLTPQDRADIIDENEFQESLQQSVEQGIKQGIEQGVEQTTKEVALRMLENGMEYSLIAKMTGLSEEAILTLTDEK